MRRSYPGVIVALFISLSFCTSAGADSDAENAVKFRHAVMNAMAGHTGAFSMIAFGTVDHPEFLQSHADALADMGAQIKVLFPAGSGGDESHAKPAIWEEPEKFSEAVTRAKKATAELRDAAATGDRKVIMNAFKAVGQACKGCHESYREEHDH